MKKILIFAALISLIVLSLAVTLFPLILSFWYGNFFLVFIYLIWWAPAAVLFMIIGAIAKLLFEFLD